MNPSLENPHRLKVTPKTNSSKVSFELLRGLGQVLSGIYRRDEKEITPEKYRATVTAVAHAAIKIKDQIRIAETLIADVVSQAPSARHIYLLAEGLQHAELRPSSAKTIHITPLIDRPVVRRGHPPKSQRLEDLKTPSENFWESMNSEDKAEFSRVVKNPDLTDPKSVERAVRSANEIFAKYPNFNPVYHLPVVNKSLIPAIREVLITAACRDEFWAIDKALQGDDTGVVRNLIKTWRDEAENEIKRGLKRTAGPITCIGEFLNNGSTSEDGAKVSPKGMWFQINFVLSFLSAIEARSADRIGDQDLTATRTLVSQQKVVLAYALTRFSQSLLSSYRKQVRDYEPGTPTGATLGKLLVMVEDEKFSVPKDANALMRARVLLLEAGLDETSLTDLANNWDSLPMSAKFRELLGETIVSDLKDFLRTYDNAFDELGQQ